MIDFRQKLCDKNKHTELTTLLKFDNCDIDEPTNMDIKHQLIN